MKAKSVEVRERLARMSEIGETIYAESQRVLDSPDSSSQQKQEAEVTFELIEMLGIQEWLCLEGSDVDHELFDEMIELAMKVGFSFARMGDSKAQEEFNRKRTESARRASCYSKAVIKLATSLHEKVEKQGIRGDDKFRTISKELAQMGHFRKRRNRSRNGVHSTEENQPIPWTTIRDWIYKKS